MARLAIFALLLIGCREEPKVQPPLAAAQVAARATPVQVAPSITRPIRVRPLTLVRPYTMDLSPPVLPDTQPVDDAWSQVVADPTNLDAVNVYLDEIEILLNEVEIELVGGEEF